MDIGVVTDDVVIEDTHPPSEYEKAYHQRDRGELTPEGLRGLAVPQDPPARKGSNRPP